MRAYEYKQDIFQAITEAYLNNQRKSGLSEDDSDGRSWTTLYECVKKSLGRILSPRDFCTHIDKMTKDGILSKDDSGRRGTRVSISLTKDAKKLHNLGILGQSEREVNNKKILQLMVFFHLIKPPQPLSVKTLNKILSFLTFTKGPDQIYRISLSYLKYWIF